jgi:hypothetical protein
MEPPDDVELGHGFRVAFARLRDDLVDRHLVASRLVDPSGPGAEGAVHPAQIRRVQIPVDVVVGDVSVPLLPDEVRETTEAEEVARRKEGRRRLRKLGVLRERLFGQRRERRVSKGVELGGHGIAGFVTG